MIPNKSNIENRTATLSAEKEPCMAVEASISQIENLSGNELLSALSQAVSSHKVGIMTYPNGGKWQVVRVGIIKCNEQFVVAEILSGDPVLTNQLRINQPVGMSFQMDFVKYIFESEICGAENPISGTEKGKILLELPDKIQKIHRRAYQRQPVPQELNVKVLFWHRGYLDRAYAIPVDHYWQGQLLDLSAGGIRVGIGIDKKDCFTIGQIVGLQFTPMCYQKPILAEGHLRYITEDADNRTLSLGIEFLGLEVSVEGRTTLQRLLDIVEEYQKINGQTGHCPQEADFLPSE
jgi:c-di-GMP-binding flagellar brake protein YcgR